MSAPPDGGYGWVMVLAIFWNNAHHWGILSSYGASGTYLDYALIGGLAASQSCISICQGVCFGWRLGLQSSSSTAIIPQWFTKRRNAMMDRWGPGRTYRVLATVQIVVSSCCVLALRDNDQVSTQVRNRELRSIDFRVGRRYEVWLFLLWSFFSVMGFMVIWFSLSTFSRCIGLTAEQGSIVTAVMFRSAMSDALGLFNSYAAILCFAFYGGSLFGTFWTAIPSMYSLVSLKEIRSCLTIMWLVCVLPATSIGLELRTEGDRPYQHAQLFTGFMYIGAALCAALLRAWSSEEGTARRKICRR
ncbi:hypothetical protein BDW66DRAFT_159062 [Aspergillus desertorum]